MRSKVSVPGPEQSGKLTADADSPATPGFRPSFSRYVRHEVSFGIFLIVMLIAGFGCIAVGVPIAEAGQGLKDNIDPFLSVCGYFLIGAGFLIAVPGLFLIKMPHVFWKDRATGFKNGAMVPGIVVSTFPLEVAVMADMSQASGETCWGIWRLALSSLPFHSHDVGTRVPLVATSNPGDRTVPWADFRPRPVSYGTGARKRIDSCTARLGEECFATLAECIRQGVVPWSGDEIALVDERFHRLGMLSRS